MVKGERRRLFEASLRDHAVDPLLANGSGNILASNEGRHPQGRGPLYGADAVVPGVCNQNLALAVDHHVQWRGEEGTRTEIIEEPGLAIPGNGGDRPLHADHPDGVVAGV